MDKEILVQYTDIQQEIRDLQHRIEKNELAVARMQKKGYTEKDSVRGSRPDGTIGSIMIEGIPYPELIRRKTLLQKHSIRMQELQADLLELTEQVEAYIQDIPDSRIRRIFRYRYLDNMTWQQVARQMGRKMTADWCRITHDRFLTRELSSNEDIRQSNARKKT